MMPKTMMAMTTQIQRTTVCNSSIWRAVTVCGAWKPILMRASAAQTPGIAARAAIADFTRWFAITSVASCSVARSSCRSQAVAESYRTDRAASFKSLTADSRFSRRVLCLRERRFCLVRGPACDAASLRSSRSTTKPAVVTGKHKAEQAEEKVVEHLVDRRPLLHDVVTLEQTQHEGKPAIHGHFPVAMAHEQAAKGDLDEWNYVQIGVHQELRHADPQVALE